MRPPVRSSPPSAHTWPASVWAPICGLAGARDPDGPFSMAQNGPRPMSLPSRSALFPNKRSIPLSLPSCVLRDGPKRLPLGTFQGLAHAHFRPSTLSAEDGRIVRWCKTASSWEVLDSMLWSEEAESCARERNGGKRTRKRGDPDDENPKRQATPSTSHSIRVSPAPSVL